MLLQSTLQLGIRQLHSHRRCCHCCPPCCAHAPVCCPSSPARLHACRPAPPLPPTAVAEVLRAIIAAYRDLFKAASLTDGVLLANYALAVLVVDEVCKEVGGCLGGWQWVVGGSGCLRHRWAGGPSRRTICAASQRCAFFCSTCCSLLLPAVSAGLSRADRQAEHTESHCHAGELTGSAVTDALALCCAAGATAALLAPPPQCWRPLLPALTGIRCGVCPLCSCHLSCRQRRAKPA